ncbi:hypothetical protein GUITHDRAFT_159571 [Guillardia theta CCMP2712]|uniref:Phospholipid:diacylglycerol acyltransferase n=1 Tax=Guillardia theta (strain CCMP2712) TaxID=905079 RepID=L1JG30_GUITC|nr:hypothetical protein GUITHDRAFT_159571 [Guillardia theta CCMP2712]EKX47055.1 hypothetical protein GUITHDRAFT_159571 [Guillardia theta CCMP2712]|eukprot:XP_005834035.1 hypothetical protein GUITHDRAFT_159571 [Guillardia theta CCMP2712]
MDFTPKAPSKNASCERPGVNLQDGVRAKHPVVMLPGIVTTGLELWSGEDCAKGYFRQRMWGTMTMVQNMLLNTKCWLRHMALDPVTGLDPPNIKLRSAQGFEAADFVVGGYWVWSKLIENLADIGYDPSSMFMASYDWRLAYPLLEDRDQFFTRLSSQVEVMVDGNGAKAILVAHSMGGNVLFYFLHWATANRRRDWVDKYIHSVVGLAIPWLGVPKGISAVLSGEAKDTAEMGVMGGILDHHLPRRERRRLFRSWGSAPSMFPKGGDVFWGGRNKSFPAPDLLDDEEKAWKCASLLHMEGEDLSVEEAIDYVLESSSKGPVQDGQLANYHKWYSHGLRTTPFENDSRKRKRTHRSSDKSEQCSSQELGNETKYWTNPLEMPLPFAPNLTIYCLYGVGKETERSYFYKRTNKNISKNQTDDAQDMEDVEWRIDTALEDSMTSLGIIRGHGDGSVPLLSLGFMCQRGWKTRHWNPAGSKTVIREYVHEPSSNFIDMRGGDTSADHVDIMGNRHMINDVLMIASVTKHNDCGHDDDSDGDGHAQGEQVEASR